MAHVRNVNQIIAARNVRRRRTPYIIQNDVLHKMIAANFDYKEVQGTHQATHDWIRNTKHIFLKDVCFHSLVMKERTKILKEAVNTYLANDPDKQKMIIWKMLCMEAAQEEKDYVVSEKIALKILESFTGKTWETIGAPDLQTFPIAQGLKDAVLTAQAVFAHPDQESAAFLEKIWREHLLAAELPETVKDAYIKKLFATAHQGGFLYSLSTAYMQAFVVNSPFRIQITTEMNMNALVRFNMHGQNIEINESLPIYKIYGEDYPEDKRCIAEQAEVVDEFGVQRKINLYLFEPTIKHEIKMHGEQAVLNIMFLKDSIYSAKAVDALCVVFPELEKVRKDVELYLSLADYADMYLKCGHNYVEIERLFALFPELNDANPAKAEYSSFIPGRADAHAKGDKIFYYLGAHYNDYVADLIECEDEFCNSEEEFVLYLKLMYRLGNAASLIDPAADKGHKNFVLELLKKYYAAAGVANISLGDADLNASKYKEAYQYFVSEGVFAGENKKHAEQWRIQEQIARSPAMLHAVIEGLESYEIQRRKTLEEDKASPNLATNIQSFFVSEEEKTRGLRRAQAVKFLLLEAPTPFAKRIIVYCIVANQNGVRLRESINHVIQAYTPEILKRVISKDLKALNIPGRDFARLENEIINPLIAKINSITLDDSSNLENVFARFIEDLMQFDQKDNDIITSTASNTM